MDVSLEEITRALSENGEPWKTGCEAEEAEAIAETLAVTAPGAAVRTVQTWIWLDIHACSEETKLFSEDGLVPAVLYTHRLLADSTDMMRRGNWVCTTPLLAEQPEWPVVRTKNTSYILVGPGYRRVVRAGVIHSILHGAFL